ncbi:uncharacterized protein LAESUDRAFT_196514 [Laetiporus sulphureus 93-53]|uniref:Uncharacterized protein n=1 Tax=Laetiporus sulphureus 93-53 TaxID=1314785 RepID=A0A165E1V5_9APHY|nr:uncharacterized protein LAESUDRAFT_196514 [Laetiporus sulphureus 93-53]KZT06083.1 hypothetical protein LAESUDRAFT_196514 [Laetiporus sulphureus 93-53]
MATLTCAWLRVPRWPRAAGFLVCSCAESSKAILVFPRSDIMPLHLSSLLRLGFRGDGGELLDHTHIAGRIPFPRVLLAVAMAGAYRDPWCRPPWKRLSFRFFY